MRRVLERRPSAAMVVAVLALVVAMSGSAVAVTVAGSNGDQLIRKGTLSANRLRRHSITSTQINFKRLGKVRTARHADTAGFATRAGSATNAANALTATNAGTARSAANADALGGQPASAFLTSGDRIGTGGIVKVQAASPGTTIKLFSSGPFTMYMTCTASGGGSDTSASVSASSSESFSDLSGADNPPPNTPVPVGPSTTPTAGAFTEDDFVFAFEAPSGAQAVVSGSYGVNSVGVTNGCWANLAGIA